MEGGKDRQSETGADLNTNSSIHPSIHPASQLGILDLQGQARRPQTVQHPLLSTRYLVLHVLLQLKLNVIYAILHLDIDPILVVLSYLFYSLLHLLNTVNIKLVCNPVQPPVHILRSLYLYLLQLAPETRSLPLLPEL